jgi:hypothetical protein
MVAGPVPLLTHQASEEAAGGGAAREAVSMCLGEQLATQTKQAF